MTKRARLGAYEAIGSMLERQQIRRQLASANYNLWNAVKKLRPLFSKQEYGMLKFRLIERKTLEETGREYGISRERVRQIENRIFKKLEEEAGRVGALNGHFY